MRTVIFLGGDSYTFVVINFPLAKHLSDFPFKFKPVHFRHIDIDEYEWRHLSLLIDSWDDIVKSFFPCKVNSEWNLRVSLQDDLLKHLYIEEVIVHYHDFNFFALLSHKVVVASFLHFNDTSISKCLDFVMNIVVLGIYRREVLFDGFSLKNLDGKNGELKRGPETLFGSYLDFSI